MMPSIGYESEGLDGLGCESEKVMGVDERGDMLHMYRVVPGE